jgi:lipopolysaccharide export system protein LptC
MQFVQRIVNSSLLLALLLSAIIVMLWTLLLPSFRNNSAPVYTASAAPDAYMEDVVALVLDKQGKPKMKIISPKMVYYAKDDKTLLTTPQLTLYRKSPQPWYITSKFAEATEGTEHVFFKEQVVIQHAADINNPATVIKTTTLLVHPEMQLAETNDPITLIQPNLVVKGTGMHADINKGDIKLLSEARGEYVPG